VIADLDGDGDAEAFLDSTTWMHHGLASGVAHVYGIAYDPPTGAFERIWTKSVTTVSGYEDYFFSAPVLGDLDRNGSVDLFVASPLYTGTHLMAWELPSTGAASVAWSMYGHDARHTSSAGDDGPTTSRLAGQQLSITTPASGPGANTVVFVSRDPSLPLPLAVGEDPRCAPAGSGNPLAGATLRVVGAGGDFAIDLPCAQWSLNRAGDRFTYRDRSHATCNVVTIRRGKLQRAMCRGSQVAYTLGASQGEVGIALTTGGSDAPRTYCASFGPATSAKVLLDGSDGRRYVARDASAPAACPGP